ncbi:hypothetical protein E3P77_01106 [Wallemia ichthyophaga]|nr:hypothetical protein E3P77_01106 [Wallemia ichthyophaga]
MSFIDFDAPPNLTRRPAREMSEERVVAPASTRKRTHTQVDNDREDERAHDDHSAHKQTVDDIFESIGDDLATAKQPAGGEDDDDGAVQGKPRRVVAKIDAERLLGTHGLPALMHDSAHWKFAGKGHEWADLRRLLARYHLWTHKLFPKLQFGDVVERTEKICHQRRMEAALKGWKDALRRGEMGVGGVGGVGGVDGVELEREGEKDHDKVHDNENASEKHQQDALFRSPSPPRSPPPPRNKADTLDDIPDDIPPDDELGGMDADRDALENEALAELERELGGF